MAIQVLKPKFHVDECLAEIRECLEKGWTGLGFKTVEFEEAWKKYTGHKNAHYINSNTVGLEMAVEILRRENGWQPGDEIISTPITFVSTNHAILRSNLKAIFADVDDYLCLDPEDVEKKITDKTRAVMFVGYGGRIGQLEKIISICKKHNLKLILDAAHMSGTRMNGIFPGTLNGVDVTVYSFQAVKNLPTADSGMICFADDQYDAIVRKLSWLGINKDTYARSSSNGTYKWMYDVDYLGYKNHGNSIMAAIGLVQLKYLDEDNEYRRKLVRKYEELLKDNPKIKIIDANYKDECSYHIFEIAVPDRELVMGKLAEQEIYCGVHYRDNAEYRMYKDQMGKTPKAHELSEHILTLPLHLGVTEEDVVTICKTVNEVVK
ncbi:MAG: aminotransferase class V-fold PLP-dependent enzyme [Clostridia bacterium]|nr:aminotransferase class V-fold PLP-dependent enzyme [Clostridia bacterium]